MRIITKDITLSVDGEERTFRLTKLDAFSGAALLRLTLRLQEKRKGFSVLDLVSSFSEEELNSVLRACLNHTALVLPAGPNPVMTGGEWSCPELEHDPVTCMTLMAESIAWSLSGFFTGGGSASTPAPPATSP